jgi:hypothetical protein
MTVHLVTFHDNQMTRSARLCTESAGRNGVDECWIWTPESVAQLSLAKECPEVFRQPANPARAWSYWAFKPAIILEELNTANRMSPATYLIYSDAGVEFIAPVSHIIERMDQDIFLFGNNYEHAHWCKRDIIDEVWPDYRMQTIRTYEDYQYRTQQMWGRFGKQCQASVIFFRVSDYSRQFVAEWLKWCLFEGGRLIDDSPSRAPNHPEFRENRHDQAILTTMAYREGLTLHYWPASYNDGAFVYERLPCYAADDYPSPLFNHHRRRNHEFQNVA